jgi:hypothetical protein
MHQEPIQIDAARYKPFSQGEKYQCRRKGLCYYCGNSNHKLLKYPIKPKRLRLKVQLQWGVEHWKTGMSDHNRDHETGRHQI